MVGFSYWILPASWMEKLLAFPALWAAEAIVGANQPLIVWVNLMNSLLYLCIFSKFRPSRELRLILLTYFHLVIVNDTTVSTIHKCLPKTSYRFSCANSKSRIPGSHDRSVTPLILHRETLWVSHLSSSLCALPCPFGPWQIPFELTVLLFLWSNDRKKRFKEAKRYFAPFQPAMAHRMWWSRIAHIMAAREAWRREMDPRQAYPIRSNFVQLGPNFLEFPELSKITPLGIRLPTVDLQDIPDMYIEIPGIVGGGGTRL